MSDLPGVRASNGGSRSSGPVPVSGPPSTMRTPREVLRDRNARQARRQEEEEDQKAEEQRRAAEAQRASVERRAAAVAGAGAQRQSQSSSQYTPDAAAQQGPFEGASGDRRSRTSGVVAGPDVLGQPVGRTTQDFPSNRSRNTSVDLSRPAQATTGGTRRTQQSQSAPRQPSTSSAAAAASNPQAQQAPQPPQSSSGTNNNNSSSFPHAFQRWENLSAHWEGLTSYWLHKLEQNTEEIRTVVPNASTLNRQITDLSAAGANLFHAVVELQRLRASSERKFQRWFFETRADTERNQEMQAQMERQLRLERSAREEASQKRAEAEEAAAAARREVTEMRRELTISKDEARRAWEELGRSNQESLETAQSLKEGRITIVAGLQVVPYFQGLSRTDSASQRPVTRDDGQAYYGNPAQAPSTAPTGAPSAGNELEYYREGASPTNTDPFTEPNPKQARKPAAAPTNFQPPPPTSAPRQSPPGDSPSVPRSNNGQTTKSPKSPEAEQFYRHGADEAYLPPGQPASQGQATSSRRSPRHESVQSMESYVDTQSEGDTEYAIDAAGNIRRDERGRPIVFQRRAHAAGESSETFDDDAPSMQYPPAPMPEAPSVPGTSAQAMANFTPTAATTPGAEPGPPGPDYDGQGYGGWDALQTRHHHPTRLSDVLEEEEERSSRRTQE